MPARKPESTNTRTGGNVAGGGYSVGRGMTAKSKSAATAQTKAAKTYMNPTAKRGGNADALKNWRAGKDAEIYSKGQKSGFKAGVVWGGSSAAVAGIATDKKKKKSEPVKNKLSKTTKKP